MPSRLRYRWDELAKRQADAAALQELLGRGSRGFGEDLAGEHVIDAFLQPLLRARGKSGQHGLYDILDLVGLARASGIDGADIERDGYDFDGVITIAWSTAEAILAATARANAEAVLFYVRAEEKRGVWEASCGASEGDGKSARYRTPEVCQETFDDVTRPMLDALTEWVGVEAVTAEQRYAEALALSRLAYDIADTALLALRRADRKPEALRLYQLLHPDAAGDD
jgi:hypothetical protein